MEKDVTFRSRVYAHLKALAEESPAYDDAKMLVAAADTTASLKNNTVRRAIDTEWIEKIEYAIPYLDAFIRNPGIAIQENEEVLPVELTKKVSEKSIRYLSQHTNHILKIDGDDVTPSKLLNVFRDETLLTYENKFINTLLVRLIAFIDKRYAVLEGTSGIEKNYVFDYRTSFYHSLLESEKNTAKLSLKIELTSPMKDNLTDEEIAGNEEYAKILQRLQRIRSSIMAFCGSPLITAIGKNYIRPPVIRTNPILKNKNLNACLTLWEYIESVDKAGFSTVTDEFREMPSDEYVSELYSSVALQYLQFYSGVAGDDADNRLLSERRLNETFPDFDSELDLEEVDDFTVYDTDYKKLVPISNFIKDRRKLSEGERKMRVELEVALRADRILFDEYMAEQERRRLAEEERLAKLQALEDGRKNVRYRYVRTFLSRLIQASDEVKGYYGVIKNKFFSYNKVKSRISKKCETFNFGKTKLAKVDVRGKNVDVYLALDPAEFAEEAKFYNFKDVSDKKPDFPMLIRVSGPLKLKRALQLIQILLEKVGAKPIENYVDQDFYLPYETTDALVRKGLIKDLWGETPMDEPTTEEPATDESDEEIVETDAGNGINYRYVRTFLARLIQANDEVKGYYGAVKNKFFAYKKVKSRISKKCETFTFGREKLAKLDVRGKKVDLYLALDPAEFSDLTKFYNFKDVSEKKKDFPMLMRINGPLKLKRALELIQILLEKVGAEPIENYENQDFYLPYETTAALVRKGLIKELIQGASAEEQAQETAEETVENASVEADETTEEIVETDAGNGINYRYVRTFLARLIQANDEVKGYYGAVKNKFFSYKKVKSRISKKCETFSFGREKLAKLDVRGKKVDLYLALDPVEFAEQAKFYNFKDVSEKKKDFPMLMRINGPLKLKRALELIQILLEKVGAQAIENYEEQDFYLPYKTTAALIDEGLIKELIQDTSAEKQAVETAQETVKNASVETPVETVEIPVETVENAADETMENEEEIVETEGGMGINYHFVRTFMARMIQANDEVKGYYGELKNKFFAYKKVKSRISKKCETFSFVREKLAKLDVRGKKVDLYLALDPAEFAEQAKFYNFKDVSEKKKDFPMMMRINGPLKLKRALELIQILLEKAGAQAIENYEEQDFYLPYKTTAALINEGLIKDLDDVQPKAKKPTQETPAKTVEPVEAAQDVVETPSETAEAEVPVETAETETPVEETATEEAVESVETTDEVAEEETAATEDEAEETDEADDAEIEEIDESEEELPSTKENVATFFGVQCVFKPYYPEYLLDDVVEIPVSKQRFEAFPEKKQRKIVERAKKVTIKKRKKFMVRFERLLKKTTKQ